MTEENQPSQINIQMERLKDRPTHTINVVLIFRQDARGKILT